MGISLTPVAGAAPDLDGAPAVDAHPDGDRTPEADGTTHPANRADGHPHGSHTPDADGTARVDRSNAVDRLDHVEELASLLCGLCRRLERFPSLEPGPEVDALFARLVRSVVTTPLDRAHAVLADPALRAVRPRLVDLCAQGEQRLELAWATRIAASPTPHAELARFPYLDNYRQLSRMELDLLAAAGDRPVRSVAFVGCGPLPLSALLLANGLGVPVDCLDRDPTAIALARRATDALDCRPGAVATAGSTVESLDGERNAALATPSPVDNPDCRPGAVATAERASGHVGHPSTVTTARRPDDSLGSRRLRFRLVDAGHADLSAYDVVVLAALVGTTPTGKGTILRRMAHSMAPGALLLARSARGLRTLLYPAVDLRSVPGFDLLTVVHPVDDVINSALVARVA